MGRFRRQACSNTDRLFASHDSCYLNCYVQGGHSPGKPGKPGKVREFQSGQGKWKKSGKLKFILDFERAEELKLQLLAACEPGFWICSSLTLL